MPESQPLQNTAHQIALCCHIHTIHPINEQCTQHDCLELSHQGREASGLLIKEQKLTNLSSTRLMDSSHCHFSLGSFVLTMVVRPFLQTPCYNYPFSHLGSGQLLQSPLFRFLDPRRISSWKSWNNSSQTIVGFQEVWGDTADHKSGFRRSWDEEEAVIDIICVTTSAALLIFGEPEVFSKLSQVVALWTRKLLLWKNRKKIPISLRKHAHPDDAERKRGMSNARQTSLLRYDTRVRTRCPR